MDKTHDARIKDAELQKIIAETEKLEAEKVKAEAETKEIRRRTTFPRYFLQIVIAGILMIPLLWFFVKEFIHPLKQSENIKLGLENAQKSQELAISQRNLDLAKIEFGKQVKLLKEEKRDYLNKLNNLVNEYERLKTLHKRTLNENSTISKRLSSYQSAIDSLNKEIKNETKKFEKFSYYQLESRVGIADSQAVDFRKYGFSKSEADKITKKILASAGHVSLLLFENHNPEYQRTDIIKFFKSTSSQIVLSTDIAISINAYIDSMALPGDIHLTAFGEQFTKLKKISADVFEIGLKIQCEYYTPLFAFSQVTADFVSKMGLVGRHPRIDRFFLFEILKEEKGFHVSIVGIRDKLDVMFYPAEEPY